MFLCAREASLVDGSFQLCDAVGARNNLIPPDIGFEVHISGVDFVLQLGDQLLQHIRFIEDGGRILAQDFAHGGGVVTDGGLGWGWGGLNVCHDGSFRWGR